ncbi:MFS transporter [Pseudolysinimonas sp.]|uniref:MFS transporter n=1 Tax=Pseudolysinimonas sp. TaxID=2680009 RepID=UPI00286CA9BD|nr:MFS transporter [Pseudolysinimonas sp.]
MTDTTQKLSPLAEPVTRVPGRWVAAFATAWLGIWMAQLTPVQLQMPAQIEAIRESADWVEGVVAFGIMSGIAGAFALMVYPLAGALSDRTTSRLGRRKPWIMAGTLLFAVSLGLLGLQTTFVGMGVFWTLAIIGFCILTAALTATISDQVPVDQRGIISGWIAAPQAIGLVLGLVLIDGLGLDTVTGYLVMAGVVVVLVIPFLVLAPDARLAKEDRPPLSPRSLLAGFWISPRTYPDFGWTLLSRILVNVGNALGTTLLFFFLAHGLGRDDPTGDLIMLSLVYVVFIILSSLLLGRWSDRVGRRKPFVVVSALFQAVAAGLLAFVPDFSIAIIAGALLGIGYGAFLSVDQALATQVLPNAATRGKDLGIMNIATTVPQAVAPLLGAWIVAVVAGFTGLFVISAVATILGALAVLPVKAVR